MPSRCSMVPNSDGERAPTREPSGPAVATPEEFDAAYQRPKDGVAVTEIIERGYGKTFISDPNGIRLQT